MSIWRCVVVMLFAKEPNKLKMQTITTVQVEKIRFLSRLKRG